MNKLNLIILWLLCIASNHQTFSQRDCNAIQHPTEQRLCMVAMRAMKKKIQKDQNEDALSKICEDCGNCAPDVSDEQGKGCAQKCRTIYDLRPNLDYTCANPNEREIQCSSPCLVENTWWCKFGEKWSGCAAGASACKWPKEETPKPPNEYNCELLGYICTDLNCLRTVFNEKGVHRGKPLRKALRKEYRLLSDSERERFHAALSELKRTGIYDKFVAQHYNYSGKTAGAHYGPAFLPWHREYIKRMEIALRTIDPDIGLPYWDISLDSRLQDPRDSVLWSDELMGRTNARGQLVTGPFRDWSVETFLKDANDTDLRSRSNHIIRKLGGVQNNFKLLNDSQIDELLFQPYADLFLASNSDGININCPLNYYEYTLEYKHGWVHSFVGGHLFEPELSSNDPIFFLLHSFVDYLWEFWRTMNQNLEQRESVYPNNFGGCAEEFHKRDYYMAPFPISNSDGLSNNYTDNLYYYQLRPTCSYENANCGSKFLFCDYSHGSPQCVSKLKRGSICYGYFYNEDVCYQSTCYNNQCW